MISNKLFILKENKDLGNGLGFQEGQEFHIVSDVVYMQGMPITMDMQKFMYKWITENEKLFRLDSRSF